MGRLNIEEEQEEKPRFKHFSHEHLLEFTNVNETGQATCSGCGHNILPGKGYYTCKSTCVFALHVTCFNMPRKIHHPAHIHDLILISLPSFDCKACGDSGSGFSYNCRICSHNYHSLCSSMPLSAPYEFHSHTLKLEFSPPYKGIKGFCCDVCQKPGADHWVYRCGTCGFDAHLNCAISNKKPVAKTASRSRSVLEASTSANQGTNFTNGVQVQPNYNPTMAGAYTMNQTHSTLPQYNRPMAAMPVNQGYVYGNQVGSGSNQGGLNGMNRLIIGAGASGIGQAVCQEGLHSAMSGLGINGSDSLDVDVDASETASCWFGGSDIY